MRIGIVSDTHGDASAWEKLINSTFSQLDLILHAGDVLYHGPRNPVPKGYNPGKLAEMINSMPVPVLIARGNCDAEVDQLLIKTPLAHPYLFTVLNGKRVLVHHGHTFGEEKVKEMVEQWKIDLCISGHTHLASCERINRCIFFNPGSCALPKGNGIATVGIWDDTSLKLIELASGQTLKELTIY